MPTPEQVIAQLERTVAALEAAGGNEALVATVRAQLEQARRALAAGRPIDLAQIQEPGPQSSGEGAANPHAADGPDGSRARLRHCALMASSGPQNPSSVSRTASQLKRSVVRRPPELDLSAALPYKSEGRL